MGKHKKWVWSVRWSGCRRGWCACRVGRGRGPAGSAAGPSTPMMGEGRRDPGPAKRLMGWLPSGADLATRRGPTGCFVSVTIGGGEERRGGFQEPDQWLVGPVPRKNGHSPFCPFPFSGRGIYVGVQGLGKKLGGFSQLLGWIPSISPPPPPWG